MNEQINKIREQTDWKPWSYVITYCTVPTRKLYRKSRRPLAEAAEETTQIIFDMMGKA